MTRPLRGIRAALRAGFSRAERGFFYGKTKNGMAAPLSYELDNQCLMVEKTNRRDYF